MSAGEKLLKNLNGKGTPKAIKAREGVMKWVFLSSSAFSIFALLAIFIFMLSRGIPAIAEIGLFDFLFGKEWHPDIEATNPSYGILPMILGSIYVTGLATLIGVTLGLLTSIFIFKFCPKKIVGVIKQLINLLAGIPSVIFGLFGLLIVVPALREISPNFVGEGILAASIILSIMILPTIVSISLNALTAVPKHLYEGALALGATKEQSVFKVVLPAAKSGVLASIVLSIGRAIGETMAVIMVIGGSARMPSSLMQSIDTMTSAIARGAREADGLALEALIAIGVVLFFFTLILNVVFMALKNRGQQNPNGKSKKRIPVLREIKWASAWCFTKIKLGVVWIVTKTKQALHWLFVKTKIAALYRVTGSFINDRWRPRKRQKAKYIALRVSTYVCASIAVATLIGLIVFILIEGLPHISWHFIFGEYSLDSPTLMPALKGTVILIGIAIAIAAPIGIATAIFLSEYAARSRIVRYIRVSVETLAAIPSIVYGLFGYIVFVGVFGWGYSLLAGGVALSIMILPTIIRTTEESLLAVPQVYREGAFALGASKVRATFKVVLPSAAGGILSSLILAIGRIVSESAVLILTIGMLTYAMPEGVMSPGTSLALSVYYFGSYGFPEAAAATGVVLLVFVMILNLAATLLGKLFARGKS